MKEIANDNKASGIAALLADCGQTLGFAALRSTTAHIQCMSLLSAQVLAMGNDHTHTIFVYGTLKRDCSNHHLLRGAKRLGSALTAPEFRLYSLGAFPAAIAATGHGYVVHGELYEVDDDMLSSIDWLEGHPNFYKREVVETSIGPAWIYLLNEDKVRGAPELGSGVWPE